MYSLYYYTYICYDFFIRTIRIFKSFNLSFYNPDIYNSNFIVFIYLQFEEDIYK